MDYTLSKEELFTLLECMRYAKENGFLDACDEEVRGEAELVTGWLDYRFKDENWAEV